MRIALVLVVLLLGGCAGAYHTSSDGRLQTRIDNSYKARDACLAKNAAADGIMSLDAASVAQAAALACTAETDKLIEVSNRDGDPSGRQPHPPGFGVPRHGLRAAGPRPVGN